MGKGPTGSRCILHLLCSSSAVPMDPTPLGRPTVRGPTPPLGPSLLTNARPPPNIDLVMDGIPNPPQLQWMAELDKSVPVIPPGHPPDLRCDTIERSGLWGDDALFRLLDAKCLSLEQLVERISNRTLFLSDSVSVRHVKTRHNQTNAIDSSNVLFGCALHIEKEKDTKRKRILFDILGS